MAATSNDHARVVEAPRLLASLQECRAEMDASQSHLARLRAAIVSVNKRIRQVDEALAVYFSQTKNPFKLVLSRVLHPGAMRQNRKGIEAELKAMRTDLKELHKIEEKPASASAPSQPIQAAEGTPHHVIITGTGRAGTTFLMELLTSLGLETGYQHYSDLIDQNSMAGLERDICEENAPYIIKSPHLCDYLGQILGEGKVVIDHAFIPVRGIQAAARSRAQVSSKAAVPGKSVWGGFWDAGNLSQQETVLMQKLSNLIVALAQYNVPSTLLSFPRLVEDAPYLYEKLTPILDGMCFEVFEQVFKQVARPDLVTRGL